MRIGCVVMAAGNACRFGENKLAVEWRGRPLVHWALEAVPRERAAEVVVVTQYPQVEELAGQYGFRVLRNPHPERGISGTIRIGLQALLHCDAVVFMVSDQPMLRRETVEAELDFFLQQPDHIAALSRGGVRGNPCVFPAAYYPELLALEGDRGGGEVIGRHPGRLRLFEAPAEQLEDVDTPLALEKLRGSSR